MLSFCSRCLLLNIALFSPSFAKSDMMRHDLHIDYSLLFVIFSLSTFSISLSLQIPTISINNFHVLLLSYCGYFTTGYCKQTLGSHNQNTDYIDFFFTSDASSEFYSEILFKRKDIWMKIEAPYYDYLEREKKSGWKIQENFHTTITANNKNTSKEFNGTIETNETFIMHYNNHNISVLRAQTSSLNAQSAYESVHR